MTPAPVPPDGEPRLDDAAWQAATDAIVESPIIPRGVEPYVGWASDLAELTIRAYLAAGRAAASPDPRVPSGLPIGYGGPTVKSDPVALLAQVKAIVDEQLDEREGFGPWRRDQFMRIDALLRDVSPAVSPDPPRTVLDPETGIEEPVTTGRIPDAEFVEPPLMPPAASPDERLREENERLRTMLGKVPQEQLARIMAAADRDGSPDA